MKFINKKKVAIALAITGIAALFTGCGSANGVPAPMTPAPVAPVGVGVGSIYGAGCLPLSQPIGFSATTGVFLNSNTVKAGMVPNSDILGGGGSFGTVTIGTGGTPGQYQTLANAPGGSLSMNITPGAAQTTTYGVGGTTASIPNGILTISSLMQSQINSYYLSGSYTGNYGYGYGYGTYTTPMPQQGVTAQQICVRQLAISMSIAVNTPYSSSALTLYGGRAYLYLGASINGQITSLSSGGNGYAIQW